MTDAQLEHLLALDASPGPALAIDAADADALIDAALDGAGFGPFGGGGGSGAGAAGKTAAGLKLAIGVAAAIIAVAVVLLLRRGRGGDEQVAAVVPDAAIPDAAVDGGAGSAVVVAPPPVDAPDEEPSEIDMPGQSAKQPAPGKSVADLLGEANAKRAAKEWRESDVLYGKVVDKAPRGLALQTALISSASLRLEHLGDPKGAAQRFRRALAMAPKGALAEDARWGLAEAMRATGDRNAEAAALDDFLAHHGGSPLAGRAKSRRAELP